MFAYVLFGGPIKGLKRCLVVVIRWYFGSNTGSLGVLAGFRVPVQLLLVWCAAFYMFF